ncbi:hypothetical protein GOODEAATRI_015792, partial [Goodea atripinnis]
MEGLMRGLKVEVLRETGRQYPVSCCLLLALLALTVLLNRYIHIFMVFWSLLAGIITFYCSLGPDSLLPNVFFPIKPRNNVGPACFVSVEEPSDFIYGYQSHTDVCWLRGQLVFSIRVCLSRVLCVITVVTDERSVCCRPTLLLENHQPWLDLKVHSKVDASVAEVFELVLEKFVYPWYRDITEDDACLDEVRMTFRFFASVLIRRAQKVDIPAVFADKVMKAVMKHIEIIARARAKGPECVTKAMLMEPQESPWCCWVSHPYLCFLWAVKNMENLQRAALEEYGDNLHVALHSRKEELLYLRKLTEMLFSYAMPSKATDC